MISFNTLFNENLGVNWEGIGRKKYKQKTV